MGKFNHYFQKGCCYNSPHNFLKAKYMTTIKKVMAIMATAMIVSGYAQSEVNVSENSAKTAKERNKVVRSYKRGGKGELIHKEVSVSEDSAEAAKEHNKVVRSYKRGGKGELTHKNIKK